ncbi:MAG: ERAP1-like C-terminal domain-containing protein [Burkholderiales bacterium]|nr:ERAP1-like C-terminal domain-containing protein [Burkholderiales bacterium]
MLLPEFAYAGMEHAGASFLREDSVLFVAEPGQEDLLRRAQLIFHEAAHQWFGDLVTMRWFDDLWLKEGFASLMAHEAACALLPEIDARIAWHRSKELAYETDATEGTTPVRRPLANLALAKSTYGNVVYHKAPAVLQLAESLLGEQVFREAIRTFLARHAWAVVDWTDLVGALERASERSLREWAGDWILQAGMPCIECVWHTDAAGRIASLALVQTAARPGSDGAAAGWSQRLAVALGSGPRVTRTIEAVSIPGTLRLDDAAGLPAPDWVFANAGDCGYGWFALDARSRVFMLLHLPDIEDGFLRALLWDALWQAVRDAEVAPRAWIDTALRGLRRERDALTVAALLGALQRALRWYVDDAGRDAVQPRVESVLRETMLTQDTAALRIASFRAYASVVRSARGRDDCVALLEGDLAIPQVGLRTADRFRLVRALLALGDGRGETWLDRLAREGGDDARRMALAAAAARPDAASKAAVFARLLDSALPERWVEEAAAAFNVVEHEAATLAHLEPALRSLPRLVRERRIFFVGGQRSAAACAVVERALREAALPDALQRKLLEAHDALARCARIRARFASGDSHGTPAAPAA